METFEYPSEQVMIEMLPTEPGVQYYDSYLNQDDATEDRNAAAATGHLKSTPGIGSGGKHDNIFTIFELDLL